MTDETKTPEVAKPEKRTYRKTVVKKKCTICGKKYSPQGMTSHMRSHEREAALAHSNEITPLPPTEFLAVTQPSSFSILTVVTDGEISRVSINKLT